MQFIWLSVCIKKSLLCNHDNQGDYEVRVQNIHHTKSGTTRKVENTV